MVRMLGGLAEILSLCSFVGMVWLWAALASLPQGRRFPARWACWGSPPPCWFRRLAGRASSLPVAIAPTGLAGMFWRDGEIAIAEEGGPGPVLEALADRAVGIRGPGSA